MFDDGELKEHSKKSISASEIVDGWEYVKVSKKGESIEVAINAPPHIIGDIAFRLLKAIAYSEGMPDYVFGLIQMISTNGGNEELHRVSKELEQYATFCDEVDSNTNFFELLGKIFGGQDDAKQD